MAKVPQVISSQSVYKNAFEEIKVDTLQLDEKKWEQAYFVKPNKNGVGIVPVDETGIYLVYQYRHACGMFLWQIPMGMVDPGSTERDTAQKELEEEVGLKATTFTLLGSFFAEPGMSNQKEFIYLAKGFTKTHQHVEETEVGMKVKHFTFDEVKRMIENGEIQCGFTLSALLLLQYNLHSSLI